MTGEAALFYLFGVVAVVCGVAMVVLGRSPVASVLNLLPIMLSLAGIYVLLEAHLVAVLQIILYSGAVLVFLLFTLVLDDPGAAPATGSFGRRAVAAAGILAAVVVGGRLVVAVLLGGPEPSEPGALPEGYGSARVVGRVLFTDFVVPVEVAGLLLLAAMVGAVFLARQGTD